MRLDAFTFISIVFYATGRSTNMYFKCCVSNCDTLRKDALHKFPSDLSRNSVWLQCLKNANSVIPAKSVKNSFVCKKHFEKQFFSPCGRLRSCAIPTLFLPAEISSGAPVAIQSPDPHLEHNYFRQRHCDHTYAAVPLSADAQGNQEIPAPSSSKQHIIDNNDISACPGPSRPLPCQGKEDTSLRPPQNDLGSTKTSRKRIINKVDALTPTCRRIYKEYNKCKSQVDFQRRAKRALKFSKETSFEEFTKKLKPLAKKFMAMQINNCTKKKQGCRFTLDEKLISLSIMKQSPKCYRFLHKIFILPSIATLNKMVSHVNIEAGISPQLFDLLRKEVDLWPDTKKICSILFDEVSLSTGLTYNCKKDQINGFVELEDRKSKIADHALVFMLRGAVHKWQQPIAYYFCEGATSAIELKKILTDIVNAVVQIGLKPIVIGCDQGAAFQSAVKIFQEETRREQLLRNVCPDDSIKIGLTNLYVIFDPSHLIKGIRNNFISKDLKCDGKISRWQDIIDVYMTDCSHTEMRLLHKLNDEHVIPDKIKKMKVKNCVRVLSKTVAAALTYTSQFSHYIDGKPVSETMKNTAEAISFFDDLFDSINGAASTVKEAKGKILRIAVRESTPHHEFWREAIKKLNEIKFIEKGQEKKVPTLKIFVTTLKSYIKIWDFFKNQKLPIMRPRYFNTDPIENFFGQVRAYNYRNNDPTCHTFSATFKSLILTRVIKFHSESYNCEDDSAKQNMLNLKSLFEYEEVTKENVSPSLPTRDVSNIVEVARRERLNTHSRAYTTGWVVRKILGKHSCPVCKNCLTTESLHPVHEWISHREYKNTKNKKKLNYPSERAVRCFGTVLTKTNEFLENHAYRKDILKEIKEEISKDSFVLVDCYEHQAMLTSFFIDIVIRFGVFNWCSVMNKILKGVDIARLKNKTLPKMQAMAYNKYHKRLRNKSFNK